MRSLRLEIYKKQRLIIYVLITLCLLFGNYKLFFKPTIGSLIKTLPKARELQRNLNFARDAMVNIPKYKKQIEELRSELSSYRKKFSTKQETSYLLKELSEMAKNSGVKIIAIKPHAAVIATQQGVSKGVYQKFPISIQAVCGYHQLGSFLNKLENADIFMRVTDINITSNPQDSLAHLVNILLNTYIITESL